MTQALCVHAPLTLHPFRISAPDDEVTSLRQRLAQTRWPEMFEEGDWGSGTDSGWLRRICDDWRSEYDWRGFEQRLNAHPQFLTDIDGQPLHFYHLRSPEPDARPLLISHGWPGSVVEFLDVMGPLSDPRAYGADASDAFHLVVPSLPGFGYSTPVEGPGMDAHRIAEIFHVLMGGLGYERYFAQGGDWGSAISSALGARHPDAVRAIHLNFLSAPPPDPAQPQQGLDTAELQDLERNQAFAASETAYQQIQRTKPQSLAYGLNDSPVGLAAWILEKFHGWGDRERPVDERFQRDRLLDNLSLYWLSGCIGSSMRLYQEHTGPGRYRPIPPVRVPTGHSRFPHEILRTPRAWAEAQYDIRYWKELPQGGHFPAMEVPDLYVDEVRGFFRSYR